MGLKEYFDKGMTSTLIYAAIGIAAGYASFLINNPRMALAAAAIILAMSTAALKIVFKTNYKWLASNGAMIFIFVWFIVWTIFYNLGAA